MDDVYIVTGAGSGIGRATALELADRGARLVVNDLGVTVEGEHAEMAPAEETVATIADAGGRATAHEGDVSDPDYADSLVADAAAEFGRVDGVVNFAGILRNAPLLDMAVEDFDAVVSVHLRGHFSMLRAAGRHWAERDGERERSFLCVSSQAAFGRAEEGNYAAAKAGVLGLMRTAAREFDDHDVRVNAVLPTATTRVTDYVYGEDEPVERDPSKVAPAVGFLLGDGAGGITGCTVRIAEDTVGLVSDPEITRTGLRDGGWDVESLEERFETEICAGEDLDRSGPTF